MTGHKLHKAKRDCLFAPNPGNTAHLAVLQEQALSRWDYTNSSQEFETDSDSETDLLDVEFEPFSEYSE